MSEPNTPTPTPPPYGTAGMGPVTQPWVASPPPRKSRTGLAVLLVLVTAVGALCVFGATYVLTDPGTVAAQSTSSPTAKSPSARGGVTSPSVRPSSSARASASASVGPTLPSDKEPVLRPGVAPKVFAEKFDGKKYVMKFKGWPFAFETHGDWGCLKGSIDDLPDAHAWGCINEKTKSGQKINVMLRRCVPTCTASVMTAMNKAWLTDSAAARKHGDRTFFSETNSDNQGRYAVDLSHFMAEKPGGPLQWQVGVYVYSPPNIADDVKMTLNSILYQAG